MENLPSPEELRAALEFATSRNYVDIEMEAREAEGAIRILSAAVRGLYEALEWTHRMAVPGYGWTNNDITQLDSIETEVLDRYRAVLAKAQEAKNGKP